jgi:hypothetical protein
VTRLNATQARAQWCAGIWRIFRLDGRVVGDPDGSPCRNDPTLIRGDRLYELVTKGWVFSRMYYRWLRVAGHDVLVVEPDADGSWIARSTGPRRGGYGITELTATDFVSAKSAAIWLGHPLPTDASTPEASADVAASPAAASAPRGARCSD